MGTSGIVGLKAWGSYTTETQPTVTGFSSQHICAYDTSNNCWTQKIFHFTVKRSPERLAKIAMADYISSHPGGVLGKVFN